MTLDLTIADIVLAVNIIDVCTERGAFKGTEISAIGNLREKFTSIIELAQKETPESTQE